MLTHAQVWNAIDRLADAHGYSTSGLAKRAGLDPTTFNKSKRFSGEGKERWPSTESVAKVLNVTGTDFVAFAKLASDSPAKV
jgi:phage repressor protein C with HTH and peptisase S24 domain